VYDVAAAPMRPTSRVDSGRLLVIIQLRSKSWHAKHIFHPCQLPRVFLLEPWTQSTPGRRDCMAGERNEDAQYMWLADQQTVMIEHCQEQRREGGWGSSD